MGGGASTDTFFGGRQAATLLTKMSWWTGGIFLALSLILAGLTSRGAQPASVLEGQIQAPTPVNVAPLPLDVEPAPSQPSGQQPAPPQENR
jgi:preprotein translocase subunit SecG